MKRQWPRLFEHVRNGYLKPSDIVTHRIPLEHIAEGYHIFSAKLDGCIKPLDHPERRLSRRPTMPYTAEKPPLPETSEQLRARIPGWGADLDPRDRPGVPKAAVRPDRRPGPTGTSRTVSRSSWPRERSIEHKMLTPVFGTTYPLKGLSGAIRKVAYRSTARAAPRTGCCCWRPTASTRGRRT